MAFELKYRVFLLNLFLQSTVLWSRLSSAISSPLSLSSSCNPRDGLIGSMDSVVVRVERFDDTSINFRRDKPRLLSTVQRTVSNGGKMHFLDYNLKAKFRGREMCVSAVKETVLNEKGADEKRLYSCEQVCLAIGTERNLVTNSSSGGRVWPGKRCCVWSRKRFFQLKLMTGGPKCLSCQGRECLGDHVITRQCPPGDKCFAVTLNEKQSVAGTNSSTVPIMLGCSSDDSLRGYTCSDGCRREVKLVGSGTRKVCVRCCTGNECNTLRENHSNDTETAAFRGHARNSTVQENGSSQVKSNKNLTVILLMMTLFFQKQNVLKMLAVV